MLQKENHALRGGENFFNLGIRVNLTYFVFWETEDKILSELSSVASEGQY